MNLSLFRHWYISQQHRSCSVLKQATLEIGSPVFAYKLNLGVQAEWTLWLSAPDAPESISVYKWDIFRKDNDSLKRFLPTNAYIRNESQIAESSLTLNVMPHQVYLECTTLRWRMPWLEVCKKSSDALLRSPNPASRCNTHTCASKRTHN